MKLISREDLNIVISHIRNREYYNLRDFEVILNDLGDDYFVQDGQLVKTKENEKMKRIRTMVNLEDKSYFFEFDIKN